jgi:scyllo-inositol 2-dehydrogenase (NADP+)
MAQAKPVKVGIVGLGRIGWSHHFKILSGKANFKIVAAVDALADRRAEAEQAVPGCKTFATAEEFFKSGLAELAIVCTRSSDHGPHTIAALKAGLHVMVEKPMATSVKEADKMIAAAAKANRVLTVHQNRRDRDDARFVRQTIDSGILGKVFWIRLSQQSFFRRNDWQQLKKYGGGFLNNNGAHAVDNAIQLLASPVADVWGDLKHTVTAGDADDWVKVMLRGKNGRIVEVEQSYACAFPPATWLVAGTCGTMQIVKGEAQIKWFDPKKVAPIKIIDAAPAGRKYGNDDKLPWQEKTVPANPSDEGPDIYDNLAAVIRKKSKKLLITPASVREQIRVMDAIRNCCGWKA